MARAIMIQGTASNVGKSLLAAGLCRVFAQDGYRVAPFKSQNMSLNSAVTREGLEIGRAQAMQAECAGVEPDARMNPILLKPTGERGSQVIVGGEVYAEMTARDYYAHKPRLRPAVEAAYRSLAADFDIVVIEGAGSPAEINLKRDDFVNMGMARIARAPVLLVGDIDRGGVFAALAGTHLLFEGWERALLKGLVINKFRGDVEILRPGLAPLEAMVGAPVLGVVPMAPLDLDDEDSMSGRLDRRGGGPVVVDVAVIRLPRLSNFTDFAPLDRLEGVGVRYVDDVSRIGAPDLLILPGSKSTLADLRWLRESGLAAEMQRLAGEGVPVLGVCGGYQMLGERLLDPRRLEGEAAAADGLGLLPVETVFEPEKQRRRVRGRALAPDGVFAALKGLALRGYEIHTGRTSPTGPAAPLCELEDLDGPGDFPPRPDGCVRGNVCGCYLHGLFDAPGVAEALAGALAARKGLRLEFTGDVGWEAHKRAEYDRLAELLRGSLDIARIYQIIEEGVAL